MSKAKDRIASPRARRMWQRLIEWYGTRLTEMYGVDPPEDWREVIDEIDNAQVTRGLSVMRSQYVQHPPTFPQFEKAMRPQKMIAGPAVAGIAERLCTYAVRALGTRLSVRQLREPWTYIGSRDGEILGVVIPADGERPSHRIMVADMALGEHGEWA